MALAPMVRAMVNSGATPQAILAAIEEVESQEVSQLPAARRRAVAKRDDETDEAFALFWSVYPRRQGSDPKKPAAEKFAAKVRAGADPSAIIEGARRYAEAVRGRDPQFVAQAVTWINQERWNNEHECRPVQAASGPVDPLYAALGRRMFDQGNRGGPTGAAQAAHTGGTGRASAAYGRDRGGDFFAGL